MSLLAYNINTVNKVNMCTHSCTCIITVQLPNHHTVMIDRLYYNLVDKSEHFTDYYHILVMYCQLVTVLYTVHVYL